MVITDKAIRKQTSPAFRWGYIVLPLAVLVLALILTAVYYGQLPAEVAYRFKGDGSADRWINRNQIIMVMLLPQLILTLVAGATTWGVIKLSARVQPPQETGIKAGKIIWLMGNMMALPQSVLTFTLFDIFTYNTSKLHIMPLWVFAVIVMGGGGIVLGIFFLEALRGARRATK